MSSDPVTLGRVSCPPGRTILTATGSGRALALTVPTEQVCERLTAIASGFTAEQLAATTWEAATP